MSHKISQAVLTEAALDGQGLIIEAQKMCHLLITAASTETRIDISDDDNWRTVDEALTVAQSVGDLEAVKKQIHIAQCALRQGMSIDFSHIAGLEIAREITGLLKKFDELGQKFRNLTRTADHGKDGAQ